ncbi:hypothetical protein C8J56DRAFT_930862 [Mycena floridula]|nr:hypothetical protein C8J56DRAFT_930862 [Mycena floridula]
MAPAFDEEVVGDSEDEDSYGVLGSTSRISDFTDNSLLPKSSGDAISTFTSAGVSSVAPKPKRPMPRPAYRINSSAEAGPSVAASSEIGYMSISIADRAKLRNRDPKPSSSIPEPADVIELSSDDETPVIKRAKPPTKSQKHADFSDSDVLPPIAILETSPSSSLSSTRPTRLPDDIDVDELFDIDLDVQMMPPPASRPLSSSSASSVQPTLSIIIPPPTKTKKSKSTASKRNGAKEKPQKERSKKKKKDKDNDDGNGEAEVKKSKSKKAKEPEVFKSKEFIEDDDEDELALRSDAPPLIAVAGPTPNLVDKPEQVHKPSFDVHETRTPPPAEPDAPSATDGAPRGKKRKSTSNDDGQADDGSSTKKKQKKPKTSKADPPKPTKGKGKKLLIMSDEEDDAMDEDPIIPPPVEENVNPVIVQPAGNPPPAKENVNPVIVHSPVDPVKSTPKPALKSRNSLMKVTPMSELIRRASSLPSSPACVNAGAAYSPYSKASRITLSRIAPLHPNRRTPPPPLPPPPPPKKTKKQLELEEKWEEELIEEAGGITDWACMSDLERKNLRKLKRDREMGGWED